MSVKEILETYEEITVEREVSEGIYLFSLFGKQFLFIAPTEDVPNSTASVCLYNDAGLDIPHIMLIEHDLSEDGTLPKGKYRWVCLYENESIVNTIIPYDDKIIDAIDRLIELLTMSKVEQEREFQKEFLFYWNSQSISYPSVSVYLKQDTAVAEMDAYYGKNEVRVVEHGMNLSDIDARDKGERRWVHHIENCLYFIPIIDNREIIPPHRGHTWGEEDVKNILFSHQIEHISRDTYEFLKTSVSKRNDVILIFGMKSELSNIVFAVRLKFRNSVGSTLYDKILNDVTAVEPLSTSRKDYMHLCKQIGNDVDLLGKKALIVGAGSLGSYVAFELVKNGFSHLKIYDGDRLEEENILRWAYGGFGKGYNKASHLSLLLGLLHPEICIESVDKNINEPLLAEDAANVDLIVFTVGSSDEQLKFNRKLKSIKCSVPVVYTWLEAGGIYSHILVVDYRKTGCYECIYTNADGRLTNNRAQKNPDGIFDSVFIRNGCGGTRAAYGTAIILRTVAALLDTIEKIQKGTISGSILIDVSPDSICISDTAFPMEGCSCCGNKESK